jgi:hypothetical protein
MIRYDLVRARLAVQFLVDSSYFHHHITKLNTTIAKPRSMPFKGDAEVLNELLVIGRQNRQAMQNLIEVAEIKRGGRNEYQKLYMAAKRQRDRKVVELEQLMTGRKLSPDERTKVLQRQYVVWNKERDQFLNTVGDLSWAAKNEQVRQFWERKEREIDALAAEARTAGPIKRKYRVKVEQTPTTAFGKTLARAVKTGANIPRNTRDKGR